MALLPQFRGGGGRGGLQPQDMKWVALVLLVVQNTALVLLMRFSLSKSEDHYIVTTAVASMEVSDNSSQRAMPPRALRYPFVMTTSFTMV